MDIAELASMLTLLMGSHEGGHNTVASRQGSPIEWSGTSWKTPESDPRRLSNIAGAGFSGQDESAYAMNHDTMNLVNALHKLSYLASDRGDISTLKKSSGNKCVGPILGASAVADLLDAFNVTPENHNLGFHVTAGAPGLMYTYRW